MKFGNIAKMLSNTYHIFYDFLSRALLIETVFLLFIAGKLQLRKKTKDFQSFLGKLMQTSTFFGIVIFFVGIWQCFVIS